MQVNSLLAASCVAGILPDLRHLIWMYTDQVWQTATPDYAHLKLAASQHH